MSPLVNAPNRGYADWQRVDNYDSGQLYSDPGTSGAGSIATSVLDVSRYGYIAGYDFAAAGSFEAGFFWYIDAAATVGVGLRQFMLDSNITDDAQYRLPNMGPFLKVAWSTIGAGPWTHRAELFGTNRVHPLELIPRSPVLIDQQAIAIAAGATATFYPSGYYSGPAQWWVETGTQVGSLRFQYLTTAGTWDILNELPSVAATSDGSGIAVVPSGAWRAQLTNEGAVSASFYLTVTPTMTGAT